LSDRRFRFIGGITAGRLASGISEFVSLALAARLLGPSGYGQFSYFLAIALISAQLFDLGFSRVLTIRTSLLIGSGRDESAISRAYGTLLGFRSLFALLSLPVLGWIAWSMNAWLLAAALCLGSMSSAVQCQSAIFQSELLFGRYSGALCLPSLLRVSVLAILFVQGRRSLSALIVCYLAVHCLSVVLLMGLIPWHRVHVSVHGLLNGLAGLLSFGKWLMITAVLEVLYMKADVLSLKFLSSSYELGIYSSAFTFAGVLGMLFNSMVAYYVPLVCRAAGAGKLDELKQHFLASADLHAIVGIPAAIGIWAVAPSLFPLVFGHQYQQSIDVWPVLVIYSIVLMVNQTGLVFFALQKLHLIPMILSAIFLTDIVLSLFLVPRFGAIGAAWTVSIGMTVGMAVSWFMTYKTIGTIPNLRKMAYYLASSFVLFPIVRAVSLQHQGLSLLAKISTGVLVYGLMLGVGRVVSLRSKEAC